MVEQQFDDCGDNFSGLKGLEDDNFNIVNVETIRLNVTSTTSSWASRISSAWMAPGSRQTMRDICSSAVR
ncbi:hypothetical protein N9L68_03310 [bacterium]|nr:hypothetical protein [bacterium]